MENLGTKMKYPGLYQVMQEPEHSQKSCVGTTQWKEQDTEIQNVKVRHQMGLATFIATDLQQLPV